MSLQGGFGWLLVCPVRHPQAGRDFSIASFNFLCYNGERGGEKMENEILMKILDKLETMDGRLGKLEQGQAKLEQGQAKLEQGQNELRADVSQLKDDVSVLKCDVAGLKGDVEIIKEDTKITRSAVNTLLEWAEDTAIEVKIPLYKKAE